MSQESEIANLEWRVVEAAVAYRRHNQLKSKSKSEYIKLCNTLDEAIDKLIAAREHAEKTN
ncbi:MAG TPA: hypothetical protein VIV66_12575 [Pyrinomonadaceae bacterium]